MKRFWDTARAVPAATGFGINLDARPLRLPGGAPLTVPGLRLAEALALEWHSVGATKQTEFTWDSLPLTRLVGTVQDRIAPDPEPTIAAIAVYGETDLLCYRAEEPKLRTRQEAAWDPLLDWARDTLQAPLAVTQGVMPVPQPSASLRALRAAVGAEDPWGLAALGVLVPALGSLVLGLAVLRGRIGAAEAIACALVDESFQQEFWGLDAEAEARAEGLAADAALATSLIALARAG
ncbi:chaperone required for assembly of F1-ATPase [Humitalea rosea]|uniref:Chaperone required for assembly of F1-ATPase n=1 Tax=Humitalea rosea TaxID=990373 RepID=A0A2W7IC57_9PROT|nr:ATP12 family protein [Humitalea rosea]PZW43152.1 chaperone required for assembly of F1-ATPase [Humitalea rosea]